MIDRVSEERRSDIMSQVGSKDTAPERTVRRLLHRFGYRYRLHASDLPGRPDIVFRARRKVIFVHGCFWHGHDCRYGQLPKSRVDYWRAKVDTNRTRDLDRIVELAGRGWSSLIVWQCETRDSDPRPIHYNGNRCITVREMARLHGFPDWFRFHTTKWHGARQVGNAVPPPWRGRSREPSSRQWELPPRSPRRLSHWVTQPCCTWT